MEIQYHPLSDTTEPSTGNTSPADCAMLPDGTLVSSRQSVAQRPPSAVSSESSSCEGPPVYENVPDQATYENVDTNTMKRRSLSFSKKDPSVPADSSTYENVETGRFVADQGESREEEGGEYEPITFSREHSIEASAVATEQPCDSSSDANGSMEAVLVDGELVYQQVKYLRRSIDEVNSLIEGTSPELSSDVQSGLEYEEGTSREDTTKSSELSTDSNSPKPNSSPLPLCKPRILSSPTSPTNSLSSRAEHSSLPPVPAPRSSISKVHTRKLSNQKSPPSSLPLCTKQQNDDSTPSPTSENTSSRSMSSTTMDETSSSYNNQTTSSSKDSPKSSPLPPLLRHKTSPDLMSPSSEPLVSPSPPPFSHEAEDVTPSDGIEEDETTKRLRIEKYKEERRSFLREKFKSESFRGQTDEMLQRLKQKAISPNRSDDPELIGCNQEPLELTSDSGTTTSTSDTVVACSDEDQILVDSPTPTEQERNVTSPDVNIRERIAVWSKDEEQECTDNPVSASPSFIVGPNQTTFTKLKPMRSLPVSSIKFSSIGVTPSRQSVPANFSSKISTSSNESDVTSKSPPSPIPKFYSFKNQPKDQKDRSASEQKMTDSSSHPTKSSWTKSTNERKVQVDGSKVREKSNPNLSFIRPLRSPVEYSKSIFDDPIESQSDKKPNSQNSLTRSSDARKRAAENSNPSKSSDPFKFPPATHKPTSESQQSVSQSVRPLRSISVDTTSPKPAPPNVVTSRPIRASVDSSRSLHQVSVVGKPSPVLMKPSAYVSQQRKIKDMAAMFEANK